MSEFRRCYVPGGWFFFTVVAYDRRPIFNVPASRAFLETAVQAVQQRRPFTLFAEVVLPDHWHLIMQLPAGDSRYSVRMKRIKEQFTSQWLEAGFPEAPVTPSQARRGERGVWQPRFWEHAIQDEGDLERCCDYIHWNPRKHNLVSRVRDWPWSSFFRFVELGHYDIDWGGEAPENVVLDDAWGEP